MLTGFIVATALVTLMPGPSLIVIVVCAIERGLARSIETILGVVVADAILLGLVLSGIGAIVHASPPAFVLLKWLGALYLIYLGLMQLRGAGERPAEPPKRASAFVAGLATTILNPKIIAFLIVYFPQFIRGDEPLSGQMRVLGPLFLLVVFLSFLACALAARGLRAALANPRRRALSGRLSGISLIGCGVYTLAT